MSISLCLLWMLTLTTSTSVELQVIESSTSLTCPSLSTVTTLIGTATCRPVRMAVFTISVSCRGKEKNFMSPEVHVARYSWRLVHAGIYIYIYKIIRHFKLRQMSFFSNNFVETWDERASTALSKKLQGSTLGLSVWI